MSPLVWHHKLQRLILGERADNVGCSLLSRTSLSPPFFLFLLVAVVNTGQKQLGEGRVYLAKIHSPSLRESGQGLGDGAWGQNWATENSPHCLLPRSPWLVQPFSHNPEPPPVGSPTVRGGLPHQLLIRKIEYATHMPTGNLVKAFFSIEVLLPR